MNQPIAYAVFYLLNFDKNYLLIRSQSSSSDSIQRSSKMPPGSSPVCVWCQATSTTMWHRLPNNQIVCQICYTKRNSQNASDAPADTSTNKRNANSVTTTSNKGHSREKGNGGSGRTRSQGQTKSSSLSRRGRRSLKKRKVIQPTFNNVKLQS